MGMAPIGVFHFTGIVLTAALVALPYLWLVMPRLLPDNSRAANPDLRRYHATFRLGEATPAFGKTAAELAAILPDGVTIDTPFTGRIAPGMAADLVLFDPDKVQDNATFEKPAQYSTGIDKVWVNGQLAVDGGKVTGALPGKVIRYRV